MAQVAGTSDSYDLVGIAEDVEDIINNVSPTETPFLSMCRRAKATNTLHQWQTDALASPGANRQVEGDDASYVTINPTVMLANSTQISRKTMIISRTADRVRKYGRDTELAYQLVKQGKELKRDIEYALVRDQGSSVGGSATARSSAGIEAMITGSTAIAATGNTTATTAGYAGGAWTAPVDGTIAAAGSLVEVGFKSVLEQVYLNGGDSDVIMTNTWNKKQMAMFAGATKFAGNYNDGGKAMGVVVAGIDMYISDYGEHRIKLNRYMKQSTVLVLTREYMKVAWLDPIRTFDLAKTGDAEKKMLICEFCLVIGEPRAFGKSYGLATS